MKNLEKMVITATLATIAVGALILSIQYKSVPALIICLMAEYLLFKNERTV